MTDNLHTVWMSGELLGIVCKQCEHRAVLGPDRLPAIHRANMTRLRDLKLKCASCGASGKGADHWTMVMPADNEAAKRFLSGYDDAPQAEL